MKTIYDILRPGWNAGYVILLGLSGATLIASPTTAQQRSQERREHHSDPYASKDYSPYSNASQRREQAIRDTARKIERERKSTFYRFKDRHEDSDDYDPEDDD